MNERLPEGVTTLVGRDSVSATAVVDASPEEVFEYIRRPANHPAISGDHTVRGMVTGPERLELGSRFGMSMKFGIPYRVTSKVVEFEQNRLIAWCHFGGHRWRWVLEPVEGGRTRVTETYDQSTALAPPVLRLAGYPKRHEPNVAASVANVMAHFASRTRDASA